MHANARLTVHTRRMLIDRISVGRPVAHVADEMGISRATAYKWWARWRAEGDQGLWDRSSRPHRSPNRTLRALERRVEALRRCRKLGPARIAWRLEMPASTVHRILVRLGLNRLAWMDRPTGTRIRRIEMSRPGELVHVDIKKLGRIPDGGGWKALGRAQRQLTRPSRTKRLGYAFIHSAVDGYTRLAYSEILTDEQGATAAAFWRRAHAWFNDLGITIERVLTDNGACYRSHAFRDALDGTVHTFTRAYRPQTNGKVERFNRTLLDEWAYVRPYRSDTTRTRALDRWLHLYNHHRAHTALKGRAPVDLLSNLAGHYN